MFLSWVIQGDLSLGHTDTILIMEWAPIRIHLSHLNPYTLPETNVTIYATVITTEGIRHPKRRFHLPTIDFQGLR